MGLGVEVESSPRMIIRDRKLKVLLVSKMRAGSLLAGLSQSVVLSRRFSVKLSDHHVESYE